MVKMADERPICFALDVSPIKDKMKRHSNGSFSFSFFFLR